MMPLPEPKYLLIHAAAQRAAHRCGSTPEDAQNAIEQAWRDFALQFWDADLQKIENQEFATINWQDSSIAIAQPFMRRRCVARIFTEDLEQWIGPASTIAQPVIIDLPAMPAETLKLIETREQAITRLLSEGKTPPAKVSWDEFCDLVRDAADGWKDRRKQLPARGFNKDTIQGIARPQKG